MIAHPLFVNAAQSDFRLRDSSPAVKVGFNPFDVSIAGVYGDRVWRQLAAAKIYPPVKFAPPPPPPPPLELKDDFEATPVGSPPAEAMVSVEGKGDSLAITDEMAAGGKHSLRFQDAPGLQASFNPHLYYLPRHHKGLTGCSFDLRIEPATVMYHEWRDSAAPYRVGPSFWIRSGKLSVAGKELLTIPSDQWVHFVIAAQLGSESDHVWILCVTVPGQPAQVFRQLGNGSADWQHLDWLGFVSQADARTFFHLDSLELTNRTH